MKKVALLLCSALILSIVSIVSAQANCSASALYCDDFQAESGWAIVREDYDDTDNSISYQTDDERMLLNIGGRWDFAIAAPLTQVNAISYTLSTTAKFAGAGNLQTWGMVFGAANDFDSYYRIILMYYGAPDAFQLQVKRIDFHDAQTGSGQGPTLITFTNVTVPDAMADNTIKVEVIDATAFDIYINNSRVASITDETLSSESRFGVWASTDEYPGSDPLVDIFSVSSVSGTVTMLPPTAVTVSSSSSSSVTSSLIIPIVTSGLILIAGMAIFTKRQRSLDFNEQ